jgi:DnaJ-class molecular chaperone
MSEFDEAAPGDDAPPGTAGTGENVCPVCGGAGRVDGQLCSNCEGTGIVTEGIGGG